MQNFANTSPQTIRSAVRQEEFSESELLGKVIALASENAHPLAITKMSKDIDAKTKRASDALENSTDAAVTEGGLQDLRRFLEWQKLIKNHAERRLGSIQRSGSLCSKDATRRDEFQAILENVHSRTNFGAEMIAKYAQQSTHAQDSFTEVMKKIEGLSINTDKTVFQKSSAALNNEVTKIAASLWDSRDQEARKKGLKDMEICIKAHRKVMNIIETKLRGLSNSKEKDSLKDLLTFMRGHFDAMTSIMNSQSLLSLRNRILDLIRQKFDSKTRDDFAYIILGEVYSKMETSIRIN